MAEENEVLPKSTNVERTANQNGFPTFVGLEELSLIAKNEELFEEALHIEKIKDQMQKNLNEIRSNKDALFKKVGINKTLRLKLEKRLGKKLEECAMVAEIRRALVEQLASELPPPETGYTRLYRGEEPHLTELPDDHPVDRKWFHVNIDYASAFPGANSPNRSNSMNCRYIYIDIPTSDLSKYHVGDKKEFWGASKRGEFLLPLGLKSKAKEFARFITANTNGDPWTSA